jgi:hypothetical protein
MQAKPDVIYYRWSYSPTTGDVTLAHNHEGHPADIRFHSEMELERPEKDLIHGFAHRNESGWTIMDEESKPIGDPHIIESVERAIEADSTQRMSAYQHKDTPETFWERMRLIHGEDVGPSKD